MACVEQAIASIVGTTDLGPNHGKMVTVILSPEQAPSEVERQPPSSFVRTGCAPERNASVFDVGQPSPAWALQLVLSIGSSRTLG
jgi:hypothetical protein